MLGALIAFKMPIVLSNRLPIAPGCDIMHSTDGKGKSAMNVEVSFFVAAVMALSAAAADVYSVPEGERLYGEYAVTVDGVAAPVSEVRCSAIPFNRRWPGYQRQIEQTELCGMVRFAFDGKATVAVTANRDFKTVKVRPLSRNVDVRRDGRTVVFDLTRPGGYSVEFDGYHNNLHVFADAKATVKAATPPARQQGSGGGSGAIVFGPGFHDVGIRELKSGDTVYIDPGAIVFGGFHAKHASGVSILGCGIIDASKVRERILFKGRGDGTREYDNAERDYTLDFEDCRNIRIDGPTIRDSLAYSVSMWGCEDVKVSHVKLVGMWRYNTDGIDLRSCRRARVSDCFARTFDDSFCFKAPAGGYGNCEDNVFERCVAWTDWGKSFEVGVGCRAEHMRRVTFRDCDCIHSVCQAMDVTNVDDGCDSDIMFDDIRVECDEPMPCPQGQARDDSKFVEKMGFPYLLTADVNYHPEYSGDQGKARKGGVIDGVTLRNVKVTTAGGHKPRVSIHGMDAEHCPKNIVFEGLVIDGKPVLGPEGVNLWIGGPVPPPKFVPAGLSTSLKRSQKQ